jgi:Sel1 repeat
MNALRFIFVFTLLSVWLSWAEEAKPSLPVDERVDISAELLAPLDLERAKVGDTINLKVLQDVHLSSATTLRKGSKLNGRITLIRPRPLPLSSALASIGVLVDKASGDAGSVNLRGYVWGQVRSEEREQYWVIKGEINHERFAKIGRSHADPVLGSIIDFQPFEIAPPSCVLTMRDPRCAKQILATGSALIIRHLPPRYQLRLLYDDQSYSAARALEVGANTGSPERAFELAQKFYNGDLFAKDNAQAFRWFTAAAELGHLAAQTNLAVLCAQGEGTNQDLVSAYKWFNISAERGSEQNNSAVQKLERLLSPEQIAEAKRLSAEWLKAHPKRQ